MTTRINASTQTALSFMQELIVHMIDNDIREYRLPNVDHVFDFMAMPFSVAKRNKFLKVLDQYSEAKRGHVVQHFTIASRSKKRSYLFTFREAEKGKYIRINMVPHKKVKFKTDLAKAKKKKGLAARVTVRKK